MFPIEIWNNPIWCLYGDTSDNIRLKHPWEDDFIVPCPHCGKVLQFKNYKAICCDKNFGISFNEICQKEIIGKHNRKFGRGWASIRPYIK